MTTHESAPLRPGLSLVELVVTLVVAGVIGAALAGAFLSQSRMVQHQEASWDARSVPRAAMRLLEAELRRLDAAGGVEEATPDRITIRVPYSWGVTCGISSGVMIAALLPTDSVLFADAGYSGYAWRQADETYAYVPAGLMAEGSATDVAFCNSANLTVPSGGRTVRLTPVATMAPVASPLFLYQRVTYEFRDAAGGSGETSLWRITQATGVEEMVAGPFGPDARFEFHLPGQATAQSTAPQPELIRGIQVVLDGRSQFPAGPGAPPAEAPLTISVFFKNRVQ